MKRSLLVLAIVAASIGALAQPPTELQQSTATTTKTVKVQKAEKKEPVIPVLRAPITMQSDKIERVDGMSSQPWYRMAGTHPGLSAFASGEHQDRPLNLIWIGAPPSR
jgi:hypothetical protein